MESRQLLVWLGNVDIVAEGSIGLASKYLHRL